MSPRPQRARTSPRLLAVTLLCALAALPLGAFAQAAKPVAVVFAVNEGASTQVTGFELIGRYTPLARVVERVLGRPVKLEAYPETARFRAELGNGRFDVIFGNTVDLLAGAVRDKTFHAVVKTKNPYVAGFITAKDSPIRKPEDLRGKTILLPEKVFTTKLAEAALRDLGINESEVELQYTRLQEVVPHSVEIGSADVGVVNPAVKRQWERQGNPVLLESKPMPGRTIIASARFSQAELKRLRSVLVGLRRSAEGALALKAIGVPEFVPATDAEYLELLKYIGE
ncbi:MAG TPA: PhnD/SsuA/transferrin family substrate-binding protein [Burkholderiales bacterium]|nr:PhnD/SsuA/transferrin family substrate-binding protein [Burkholderiales bacterium]